MDLSFSLTKDDKGMVFPVHGNIVFLGCYNLQNTIY